MFVDTENEDSKAEEQQQPRSKRRKLTVLDTATTESGESTAENQNATSPLHSLLSSSERPRFHPSPKKKSKKPLKILDPLTRIIDDSLQEVFVGSKSCESHYALLTTDSRFSFSSKDQQHQWITHTLPEHGNLLHCCALWNDASTANLLLQHAQNAAHSANLIANLLETADGDGRTPYQVAQVVQHTAVAEVLEAHGGDTTNYVYDIFYLDSAENTASGEDDNDEYRNAPSMDDGDENDTDVPMMTAELTSGVGYWTPEGELVLEADIKNARSLSQETDGDIDSNCEEYGANDYPDEEEGGGVLHSSSSSARRYMDQMAFADYNEANHHNYHHHHVDDDDEYEEPQSHGLLHVNNDNYDEYDWEEDLDHGQDRRQHYSQNPYDYDED
ncbi:MAG: hypothetical protein SGILL_010467 [Bacillariaceae sp.]